MAQATYHGTFDQHPYNASIGLLSRSRGRSPSNDNDSSSSNTKTGRRMNSLIGRASKFLDPI